MVSDLLLEEITLDGTIIQVGVVPAGSRAVEIGRAPGENGIELSREAVSSHHGSFSQYGRHWFFRDEASTNGSWLNGTKAEANRWYLVRAGDLIQMADTAVRLTASEAARHTIEEEGRSLIVFKEDLYLGDYPIPEYGKAIVVGGTECDLEIEGDSAHTPSLVVERRGQNVCAFNVAKMLDLFCNGVETTETINLADRDELGLSVYRIHFNDPSASCNVRKDLQGWRQQPEPAVAQPVFSKASEMVGDDSTEIFPRFDDFENKRETSSKSGFGGRNAFVEEELDEDTVNALPRQTRFLASLEDEEVDVHSVSLEEYIIPIMVAVLVGVIVTLLIVLLIE